MDGGWWANPAVISRIKNPTAFTSNALPLGDSLLISSFRFFMPLAGIFTTGIEVLGAGAYKSGTSVTSVSNRGATYTSSFAFNQPRFQIGAAAELPYAGSLGLTGTIGYEELIYETYREGVASPGFGFGWISPLIFKTAALSAAAMFIHHNHDTSFWESGVKAGVSFHMIDSVISGYTEYTFTPKRGAGIIHPEDSHFEAFKAMLSARVFESLAIQAGFSNDYSAYDRYSNGPCAHVGLELLRYNGFPFYGGYDIGFRPGWDWMILHHVWLGLNFHDLMKIKKRS
jgi:hypothetical protein